MNVNTHARIADAHQYLSHINCTNAPTIRAGDALERAGDTIALIDVRHMRQRASVPTPTRTKKMRQRHAPAH